MTTTAGSFVSGYGFMYFVGVSYLISAETNSSFNC